MSEAVFDDRWPEVTCPTCFEQFLVPPPSAGELPSTMDYDCEICCRPMILRFEESEDGSLTAEAMGLDEA